MHPEIAAKTVLYYHDSQWKQAKSDVCLHQFLGDTIDLEWEINTGVLRISASQVEQFEYKKEENRQVLKHVPFRHGSQCPLLRSEFEKNQERNMKPCACVMLLNSKQQILVTQRSPKLLFPCAWVLPGGHLEPHEGMLEGGLRECVEEVGLVSGEPLLQRQVMIWESVATFENKIKATAIVVFFSAKCEEFEVKADEREVCDYKWKELTAHEDEVPYQPEHKTGYAEGHRVYLKLVRQS